MTPSPIEQILNDSLDEYNVTFANQMNIVFFADAVVHVTRIGRVLRQPRGNAMLVGVGGSGKQSLTRVASFVAGYDCVQIEINRGYGLAEFREDIKKLMVGPKNSTPRPADVGLNFPPTRAAGEVVLAAALPK